MATFTTVVCDSCKSNILDTEKLFKLELTVKRNDYYASTKVFQADWCFDCCEKHNIQAPKKPEPKDPATFETLFRELVREEIGEAMAGGR